MRSGAHVDPLTRHSPALRSTGRISKLSGKLMYHDVSMLSAMCSSDLIVTLHGGPYSIVTQLMDNPSCKSTFLECICSRGDFLGANSCAPTSSHSPWGVSTFLSHHARGSPLGVALSWVVSVPGSPSGGVGTSRVRLPPTGTRTMALKPPFSSLCYCSEVLRPLTVSPPPRSFLPMGIGGFYRRCLNLGAAYTWRCLILAMPTPGDALSWLRLTLATPHLDDASPWRRLHLGDALSGQPVDFLPLGPLEGL